ncbi:glucan endo-1,3-beta-glucosidase-like [Aristolochia californica]|uniref:glucan endo-1,3-beta-glucosidase-like n=1 Tax=Aristolochia californica TaxID=171875 RepID=UPI0035DA83E9
MSTSMTSFFMFFMSYVVFLLLPRLDVAGGQSIGVCYGMVADNLPQAQEVIDLYKSHNIGKLRLYSPSHDALEALRGTDIEVLVDVPNENLQEFASSSSAASTWVDNNIRTFWPDVRFKYIAVGNELIPSNNAQFILGAMQNIHKALESAGLKDNIKVSTAVSMTVLKTSFPPSEGAFGDDQLEYLVPIARFLVGTGAPFLANVYPYFSYLGNPSDISLPYALFTASSVIVHDGSLGYQNLFDAMVDALYSALERVDASNVEVVVSESGWPSQGSAAASYENARNYNQNLIRHVHGGTPKRSGSPIETYLFAMFNENQKPGEETEQHFGLFYPSKEPVYSIDFS